MYIINVTVTDKGIAILDIMLQPQYFFLRKKKYYRHGPCLLTCRLMVRNETDLWLNANIENVVR